MLPALVPFSPLPDLSLPVRLPRLQVIVAAVVVSFDRRRDQPERHGPARLDGPGGGRQSRPGGQADGQAGSHAGEQDPG
jgi:hypothetical protein